MYLEPNVKITLRTERTVLSSLRCLLLRCSELEFLQAAGSMYLCISLHVCYCTDVCSDYTEMGTSRVPLLQGLLLSNGKEQAILDAGVEEIWLALQEKSSLIWAKS